MATLTQPLKWHGGKGAFNGKLAKWIISLMPPHTHYVEPFFGGGSVLLHKDPEGVSEVVNDLNSELMNFWAVLRSPEWFAEFVRCVQAVPFSEAMFDVAKSNPRYKELAESAVDRAIKFFILCRQSRQGLQKDFATLSRNRTRGGMNEQVSAWLTAAEGLPDIHARLRRVVLMNSDALTLIKQQDGPETCFYLDPPYVHETRITTGDYKHEMTHGQHGQLLLTLCEIKGKFLLSGYPSDLYDDYESQFDWTRHELPIVNNASSKASKEIKTECVWTNF